MSDLQVKFKHEGEFEKTIQLEKSPFTIGRSPLCNLCLPFSGVSRTHARFLRTENGNWAIEDLGSTNGTKVNGAQIEGAVEIKPGDEIQIAGASGRAISMLSEQESAGDTQEMISRSVFELSKHWTEAEEDPGVTAIQSQTVQRLRDLVEIAKELNLAVSIEAIFERVREVVFRYLPDVDRLALLVDVGAAGDLIILNSAARNQGLQAAISSDESWISRSICKKAFSEKVAIQTADAQADDRFQEAASVFDKGIRSAMAVPLWNEETVVGVLYADAHSSSFRWMQKGEEDLSFFSALANLVATAVQRWKLAERLRAEGLIRQRLERYHSPDVVQHLVDSGDSLQDRLHPRECEISILFCDLVSFTALAETLTPAETANMLNLFFEEMLVEIFATRGTLDKYIGDCLMAFYGAPSSVQDHADRATRAARQMLQRLKILNQKNLFPQELHIRIAINTGWAVVGDVGSSKRVEYTALGSTINLASRMEGICPPDSCVISESTYAQLNETEGWEEFGDHAFKGIQRPVKIYKLAASPE